MSLGRDNYGFFGKFGGQFVAETLIPVLDQLEDSFKRFKEDNGCNSELKRLLTLYAGRPTPIYYASNISKEYGLEIYLKREDLLHTGAHKINNCIGQGLLTRFMGKKRVIAETGAGQHGVATATIAALLGLKATIYMGAVDMERQRVNVERMRLLGSEVVPVSTGSGTLKDGINEALKDWISSYDESHYLIGSVVGPHPFPNIVAYFQSVIGEEVMRAVDDNSIPQPDTIVAAVGGGSNAIGIFKPFIEKRSIDLIGVEAGGISDNEGEHAKTLGMGKEGIIHGCLTYLLQDKNCQVSKVHSISAGLDYPAIGPEHSYLHSIGRVKYQSVTDRDVIEAFKILAQKEGIIPALESSHPLAYVLKNSSQFKGKNILINLSGRGDKDLNNLLSEVRK